MSSRASSMCARRRRTYRRKHRSRMHWSQLRSWKTTSCQKVRRSRSSPLPATDTSEKCLARLQGEVAKRGVIDVLRHGIRHGPASLDLFYGTPSPGNARAQALFDKNIFSVMRQLQYSPDETMLALDLCLFINGLPVAT